MEASARLHRDVEQQVPPVDISSDARKIHHAVDAMAAAIRTARPAAHEGDLFDADASEWFRARIRESLLENECDAIAILASARDEDAVAAPRPVVNGRFAWEQGSFMPPSLLATFPPLPRELEYRFVERDLVLVDVRASLVVDVLPGALPVAESQ
ncbi:MAG: hypothetical protein A3F70_11155 [Acidobacteria bacterium RIFCSPLOWO2_12_FULL_67_14]|nr:MAG: hypothetical protein A3H29_16970 [Acidobacteria bacterium RIFCSPLOWO2_02_FULL_67_21]OFW39099.1 MAG: hypothetical protein A3F70_11155 [Acidobacteria bacterium RIFCSPLOWO2_12_FULL_67_14]